MITLKCPNGHTRQVPEALAGHEVTCFQCTHKWKVPGSAASQKKAQAKKIAEKVIKHLSGGARDGKTRKVSKTEMQKAGLKKDEEE